jgi:hypothetical protein
VRKQPAHGVRLTEQNGTLLEFSLCLSRACLDKQSILIYKWLKQTVFTHLTEPRGRVERRRA